MTRRRRASNTVPCRRWRLIATDRPELPPSVTERRLTALALSVPDIEELYEECDGAVQYHYAYDPGCWRTPNGDGWPPSTEFEAYECDTCRADDWSDDELAAMCEEVES